MLKRTIFLRTATLLVLLIGSISVSLAFYAIRNNRSDTKQLFQTVGSTLADEIERLLLWNDRVAIKQVLEREMETYDLFEYLFIIQNNQVYISTFEGTVPDGLLHPPPTNTESGFTWEFQDTEGAIYYDFTIPIGKTDALLRLGMKRKNIDERNYSEVFTIALVGFSALVLGLLLSSFISFHATKEISLLAEAIRSYGDLGADENLSALDTVTDVTQLAKIFVGLVSDRKRAEAEREKLEGQLRQAQKMESIGRLAGGVAHDYNNMLNIILGYTEMALEKMPKSDPLHNNLMEIYNAARRSADVTRQLLAFARKQTTAPKNLDLNETIENMLKMLKHLIGENIELSWKPEIPLWPVKMDPVQIDQILANLCINAKSAISDVGEITIQTENAVFKDSDVCDEEVCSDGEYVLLSVMDNGCGMDAATLQNIFEPFFTTKGVGEGTGLGLATVYGIVKQNKGFIDVSSEPGQGTAFKIYLPKQ